ncbi:Uncharacterised protein [Suttonella ornithocola]|uniref:Uncharacterized protein n=1 Tax=Suttonella ornithocola TaxID=279832 RepID=A0A380MU90_9GAMM|nr:Uncharacterised protein [Suttonella ornithocola]
MSIQTLDSDQSISQVADQNTEVCNIVQSSKTQPNPKQIKE